MRLLFVCAWGLLSLFSTARAQVRVTGQVTNENKAPVAGAGVTMEELPGGTRWHAISDPTGAFALELPAAGVYSLKVDRDGFYVFSEPSVKVSQSLELHVALQSTNEIHSSIEVKSVPGTIDMDRVASQTTLSSRTLYDVPFPNQNNLRSGLRLIPEVIQDSSGGLHLFGGSEDQAEYNFEGFRLNDPLTGQFDARLSLESVESVDVQAAPSGAEMGRSAAGTMTLHARTGEDDFQYSFTSIFPGIDLGQGTRFSSWTPRVNISGPWRKGRAWFFNTSELQFVRATVPQLANGENSSKTWRFNDLLHNQINLSQNNILFVGLLFDYANARHSGINLLDPAQTTVNRRANQWFGYVKDQQSLGRSSLLEFGFAASITHSEEYPQGAAPYLITPNGHLGDYFATSHRDAQRQQGLANYYLPSFHWWGEHQLKTGADIIHLEYEQDVSRSQIEYLNNAGAVTRSIAFSGSGVLNRANYENAFYLQDFWRVRPGLLIELGWRADGDHLLGSVNNSPRAGFAISPPGMSGTRISGSFARIFDATDLRLFTRPLDQSATSTYFDTSGNVIYGPVTSVFAIAPKLKDPRADVWNLGAERTLPKLIQAKLQLLRRRSSDGFDYQNTLPAAEQLPSILAGAPNPGTITTEYLLTNQRQDHYESVELAFQQPLKGGFEWMASYTRSRATSNAIVEQTIDQPLSVSVNSGPLPWDAPNRFLTWGYLPAWRKNWAIAYMLDWHTGLPFSIQNVYGQLVGTADDQRFRQYFELNLYVERQLSVKTYRVAVRAGFNNVTGHFNPNLVDNVLGGPLYLREAGGQPRALNFRLRLLGRQ